MMRYPAGMCRALVLSLCALAASAGCNRGPAGPAPLSPQTARRPISSRQGTVPHSQVDQPGPILYDNVRVDLLEGGDGRNTGQSVRNISETVERAVQSPRDEAAAEAATRPSADGRTARPATGPSSGQYMTIGGVVAEVNGKPIYANQVLEAIEPLLLARAAELDEAQFRTVAAREIEDKVQAFIDLELTYAAAERQLDQNEKDLAWMMTERWRNQQVTEAGGSVEAARRRAAAQGDDFDALAEERHRVHMAQVYFQKRVHPRIQVTADDMRREYAATRGTTFTIPAQARFELISIDPRTVGSRDAALAKTEELRGRLERGDDVAELLKYSHAAPTPRDEKDPSCPRPIQRGAFALEKVEQAVWALNPGQVTPVVEEKGAFHIAKLLEKTDGRTMVFEDETVQRLINEKLRAEQFRKLRELEIEKLTQAAVVRTDPAMKQTALEMAMQRYPRPTTSPTMR